ncbi:hypothetical protein EBU02_00695 [bacterium]|nr:hypothetical protein [bacterium]
MQICRLLAVVILIATGHPSWAQNPPPRENPYDLIGKIFQPLWGVLLAESNGANRAATLSLEMSDVSGRLPESMKGATLLANVQFPDKVKLQAPVLGETFTVCRNGNEVWVTPGSKVKFLISSFNVVPKKNVRLNTPISLPITPQPRGGEAQRFLHERRYPQPHVRNLTSRINVATHRDGHRCLSDNAGDA